MFQFFRRFSKFFVLFEIVQFNYVHVGCCLLRNNSRLIDSIVSVAKPSVEYIVRLADPISSLLLQASK